MAGYSGKPVVQKLGLKPGFRIFVDGLSVAYGDVVGELPADLTVAKTAKAPLDAVHLFATEAKGLAAKLRSYRQAAQGVFAGKRLRTALLTVDGRLSEVD